MGKFGRPTTYTDEMLNDSLEYLGLFEFPRGERECSVDQEVVPTIVGLCKYINRSESSIYAWIKEDNKADFLDIINTIKQNQHLGLVSGGLDGTHNPLIAKLMLSKHGHGDKMEVDNTSSDGSMTPNTYSPEQYKSAQDNIKDDMEDLD